MSRLEDALGQPTEPIYSYDIRTDINSIVDVGWLLSSVSEPGERFSVILRRSGMIFTEHLSRREHSSTDESQWHATARLAEGWLTERDSPLANEAWAAALARFPPLIDVAFGRIFETATSEISCKKCGAKAHRHAQTGGGGAYKPGDTFDTTIYPHYFCFDCGRAWKIVNGELLPDPVTGKALSTCQADDCGADVQFPARLSDTGERCLVCENGHWNMVIQSAPHRLSLAPLGNSAPS